MGTLSFTPSVQTRRRLGTENPFLLRIMSDARPEHLTALTVINQLILEGKYKDRPYLPDFLPVDEALLKKILSDNRGMSLTEPILLIPSQERFQRMATSGLGPAFLLYPIHIDLKKRRVYTFPSIRCSAIESGQPVLRYGVTSIDLGAKYYDVGGISILTRFQEGSSLDFAPATAMPTAQMKTTANPPIAYVGYAEQLEEICFSSG